MTSEPSITDVEGYRQILDTAPDAMIIVGPDERIVYANFQTEAVFGYPAGELIGKQLDLLIPGRFRAAHAGHMARFFASPGRRPMGSGRELFGRLADGEEIPIEVSLSPVTIGGTQMVSAAIREITERKRLEAAAREAHAAAEAASAAKSEFLSSMSHELRTPLNAILGFAQLLRRDKKSPLSERHKDRVEQILQGGEHLLRLIDDILDLSRIESGNVSISREPVDVADVLESLRTTLHAMAAGASLELTIEPVPKDLPLVATDRTRYLQILMNFASNAIKYNRPGGTVAFTASRPDPGTVRVTVTDTGQGIAADKQDKLFQPFQRAGQETGPIQGTGIGLVITKRLAELLEGKVGFESVAGEGSKFWVDMPTHEARQMAAVARAAQEGPGRGLELRRKQRVLYIEDNPANVLFMRDLLGVFEGIEFLTTPTAEMGIEIARAEPPAVIIMDINLPGMSGVEALQVLRAIPETRSVPVIALTAAASERDRQKGKQAGFFRYLTKPVRVDELESALEEVLDSGGEPGQSPA